MTVFITLTTAGSDSGPFNLYSDLDGFVTPFEVGVAKIDLTSGYTSTLVPDFTSVIRVKSTAQYCINYVDITLTEPPCERPGGLITVNFNFKYIPPVGPEFIFTDSFANACLANSDYIANLPGGLMVATPGQLASLDLGETVYQGIDTNCTLMQDGFYITDLVTQEVTEIVGGMIINISYCTTTTTTTTP